MWFVHPALAGIAVVTGLIPVVIHLLNRRRHRRVPFAAMRFLLAAYRRSARRVWLEQWLLLLTRVVLLVFLGLALARPFVPASALLGARLGRVQRVILVDNSRSMNARIESGETRFDAAQRAANTLCASFPEGDTVRVLPLAGINPASTPLPPVYAVADQRALRERLAQITPTQTRDDPAAALARVKQLIAQTPHAPGNWAVYVISDFCGPAWRGPESAQVETLERTVQTDRTAPALAAAQALFEQADVTLAAVDQVHRDNVAITQLALEAPLVSLSAPVHFAVEVTNLGPRSVTDLSLQFKRDDQIVRRQALPTLEAGAATIVGVSTAFATAGTHAVEARLAHTLPDALADDDSRLLSVEVRERLPVLLVDGRPGRTRLDGQTGYLATAWAPRSPDTPESAVRTSTVTEADLIGEPLADYDLIALCNVQHLTSAQWQLLERYVHDGGGLLVFAGDLLSADNYNRYGWCEGEGMLPGRFAAPALAAGDGGVYTQLSQDDLTHPLVSEFTELSESGLFLARIWQYLKFEPTPATSQVLIEYKNKDPFLVMRSWGQGKVLVCTTTANMDWNNLAAKGDFVSLAGNILAALIPPRGVHRNVTVGDMLREPLTPRQSALSQQVFLEGAPLGTGKLVPRAGGLEFEYGPVTQAGAYRLTIGEEQVEFAVVVDPVESELRPCGLAKLRAGAGSKVRVVTAEDLAGEAPAAARTHELATGFAGFVILLLLLDTALSLWLGSRREGA